MRAIDGNGHVPDDQAPDDYQRGYAAGYNQAMLDMIYKLAEKATADLSQINAKLERMAQRPAA